MSNKKSKIENGEFLLTIKNQEQKEAIERYDIWKKNLHLTDDLSCMIYQINFEPNFEKAFEKKYPKAGSAKFSLLKKNAFECGITIRIGKLDIHDSLLILGIDPYSISSREELAEIFTIEKALKACNWEMYTARSFTGTPIKLSKQDKKFIYACFENGWMKNTNQQLDFENKFLHQKQDGTIVTNIVF